MITTETDIMALVERVHQTREALRIASDARRVASEALKAADKVEYLASQNFGAAQNALVVAAGGTDRSFIFGLPRPFEAATEETEAQK